MNLVDMQAKFRERCSGLADQLGVGVLNGFLNRQYQYDIPKRLNGDLTDGVLYLRLTRGVSDYAWPSYVVHLDSASAWITNRTTDGTADESITQLGYTHFLRMFTDPALFQVFREEPPSGSSGIPENVLLDQRRITVSPAPDEDYYLTIPGKGGPTVALGSGSDLADGITDDTHAMAVITGAAREYLIDKEDHDSAGVQQGQFEYYLGLLTSAGSGLSKRRRPRRSF